MAIDVTGEPEGGLEAAADIGAQDAVEGAAATDTGSDSSDSGADARAEADADGAAVTPPSCEGLASTCGGTGGSKDCCASNVVVGTGDGGVFYRSNDTTAPATVSDFKLDVYEVTVGRFRAFVNAGKGTQASPPAPGDGAHPKIAGSSWDSSWNASLTVATFALKAGLKCDPSYPAWTDTPNGNETRPINCVTWFEAFAFCAWDGGRLPTEAERNYAAAGGSEQRDYPWGAGIDPSKASYGCGGSDAGCSFTNLLPVGSDSPPGDGKWGQAELAGNLWEWALDWYASPYGIPCNDCADLQTATDRAAKYFRLVNNALHQ